jgi:hypothetical protein
MASKSRIWPHGRLIETGLKNHPVIQDHSLFDTFFKREIALRRRKILDVRPQREEES